MQFYGIRTAGEKLGVTRVRIWQLQKEMKLGFRDERNRIVLTSDDLRKMVNRESLKVQPSPMRGVVIESEPETVSD